MPADTSVDLPSQAQAVVIGGGAIGASVAYHLAARGWSDTVLLERDQLTCGTTWHAAGIVGPLRATVGLTRLHAYAMELFPRLEEETGQATGYKHTGGLSIARSRERMHELERVAAVGRFAGIDAHVVTPAEIGALHPLLESGDLAGGIWIPRDGQTDLTGTTLAMAKGARLNGARVVEGVTVTGFETRNHSLHAVCSTHGVIRCETAVICAGIWSRELGARAGISVPLQAAEHMYIVTEPIEALGADAPFVRELDSASTSRQTPASC